MPIPRHWLPIFLVVCGVATTSIVALANASALGGWLAPLLAGGALALAATRWMRRSADSTAEELAAIRAELRAEESRLAARARALDERLRTYQEWMEFPAPLEFGRPDAEDAGVADLPIASSADPSDAAIAELARRDAELLALLKARTNRLYDDVLNGRYFVDKRFQPDVLLADARALAEQVARLYRPDSTRPLIETNPGLMIRAIHRASLHLLVALDELPVNVKDRDLAELHGYFVTAVTWYRRWQKVEPYWPYMRGAYYAGKFALGASPIGIGASWVLSTLGGRAARSAAKHVLDYHALKILSDAVRIVGYEIANLYAGDFRRRDPEWIYGVELAELTRQFPATCESLSAALAETGRLALRSEYDRIFLYRCLAGRVDARPGDFRAAACLPLAVRDAIAERLDEFQRRHFLDADPKTLAKWRAARERRLGTASRPAGTG